MTIKYAVKYTVQTDIGEYSDEYLRNETTGKRILYEHRSNALSAAGEFKDCEDARLVRVNVREKSLGQVALEAFNGSFDSVEGYGWDECSFEEATAWNAAADAVIQTLLAGD
jgi:hypothetical protein